MGIVCRTPPVRPCKYRVATTVAGVPTGQNHAGDFVLAPFPLNFFDFAVDALRRAGIGQRCCAKRYVSWRLFGAVIARNHCVGCAPAVRANVRSDGDSKVVC